MFWFWGRTHSVVAMLPVKRINKDNCYNALIIIDIIVFVQKEKSNE